MSAHALEDMLQEYHNPRKMLVVWSRGDAFDSFIEDDQEQFLRFKIDITDTWPHGVTTSLESIT